MALGNCPRCDKPLVTTTTKKGVTILSCPGKSKGAAGCGLFINLGHVKKEQLRDAANEAIEQVEQSSNAATGTGVGSTDDGNGGKPVERKPARKRVAVKPQKPVRVERKPVERKPVEQSKQSSGGGLSGFFAKLRSIGDDL